MTEESIEDAKSKDETSGKFWSASLLNIVCALVPVADLYLYVSFTASDAELSVARLIPLRLKQLIKPLVPLTYWIFIGSLIIAGAIFFLSESPKAKDAATSAVAGFFIAIVSLVIFAWFLHWEHF